MKNLLLLILSILSLFLLTGCTDKSELHEYAYVIALGIDKSKTNPENIEVTFEFVLPIEFLSESNTNKVSTITTVEAANLDLAINLVNSYVSKKLNLTHNKLIIFSEELAYDGIEPHLSSIANNKNFRTNMYFLISKCDAKTYIENSKPQLEKNPAKFYELLLSTYKYNSYSYNSYFLGHSSASISTYTDAVALLANISTEAELSKQKSIYTNSITDMNIKAGNIKESGESQTENLGLAVFKNHKIIGELTGEETFYAQLVSGDFQNAYYSIPDPFNNTSVITFSFAHNRNTKKTVKYINGIPLIYIDISIRADIISINSNIDYMDSENLKIIEKHLEYTLTDNISKFLYKTAKELETDFLSIGNAAARNFTTWDDWKGNNWLELYRYSYFSPSVDVTIEKSGLTLKK